MQRMSFQSDIGKISYLYRDGKFPIIMLHGLGGTGNSFLKIATRLPSDFALIMLDLLGHGKTIANTEELTIANQGLLVTSILEHLGISNFALYGHSYGGWVSLNFCMRYGNPELLVLEDSAGLNPTVWENGESEREKFLDTIMRMNPRNNRDSIRYILINNAEKEKKITVEQLKKIKQRTLIMWGEKDNIIPLYFGELLHRSIIRSDLAIFPNSGHSPHISCPDNVANRVSSFMKGNN